MARKYSSRSTTDGKTNLINKIVIISLIIFHIYQAGGYIRDDQVSSIISLFAMSSQYHAIIAVKLYKLIREDASLVSIIVLYYFYC